MKRIFLLMILVSLLLSATLFAQTTVFIVDDDGGFTTYPNLASAIATAQTFAGGPHKIKIMAGAYSDADLSFAGPTMISEIYGDPSAAVGDIVFTSPAGVHNFLTGWNGLTTLNHIKLVGYKGIGVHGNSAAGLSISDMVINGASGVGIDLSGTTGATVDGITFFKLATGVAGSTVSGAVVKNSTFDSCTVAADVTDFDLGSFEFLTISAGNYGVILRTGSNANYIKNSTITGCAVEGIYLQGADNNSVIDNEVRGCTSYAVLLDAASGVIGANWVKTSCFLNNRAAGTSQGFDDAGGQNLWDGNYYSDNNFTMNGAAGEVDANPKMFMLAASAAASQNIDETFTVSFNWVMPPACSGLDSVLTAAYGFTVTYDATKLQYVPTASFDEVFFGPPDPALYTLDDGTVGQLTFGAANFTTPGLNGGLLATAQFKVIAANTGTVIGFTAVDFRDPGNNPMTNGVTPLALTLVDNVPPSLDSYIQNDPAGDDVYSDGSVAGPGPFLKLMTTITASDNVGGGLAGVYYSYDGAPFALWYGISGIAYADPTPQYAGGAAGLSEGPTHTLALLVKDIAGNSSASISYTFTMDRTAPGLTSITLDDADDCAPDEQFTDNRNVELILVATGTPTQMMVSESGDQPIVAFAASSVFQLADADGLHNVWARLYDAYNNRLDWGLNDGITLDRVIPTPVNFVAGIWPPPGPAKTGTRNITVDLASWGGADVVEYKVSETAGDLVCGAGWLNTVAFPMAHPFVLSAGDGNKTVNFASRDKAGNISAILSDGIELDSTAPVLLSYDMVDRNTLEQDCTKNGQIRARFTYSGSDVVMLQWSYDGLVWGDWEATLPSPDSADGNVATPNASNSLYIRLVDDIGNISNVMVDAIEYDAIDPTLATVGATDVAATATPDPLWGPGLTNDASFTLNLTGVSADVVGLLISQDNGATFAPEVAATPTGTTIDFPYTWTPAPSECAWLPIVVKTVDCGGRESAPISGSVYFDIAGPSITSFTGPALSTVHLGVVLSLVATDNCTPFRLRVKDAANGAFGIADVWQAYTTTPSVDLVVGDGSHTVNLEVSDYGGNIVTGTLDIMLDETFPTVGTFDIKSGNPLAADGYTSSLTGNTATFTFDADVKSVYIQNNDNSWNTGWIDVWTTTQPLALGGLVNAAIGTKTVWYLYLDSAGNYSAWGSATIEFDNTLPPPPAPGAFGEPGGSTHLTWPSVVGAQDFLVRYNFQNEYPTYPSAHPPHPATFLEGILAGSTDAGDGSDTTYVFADHQPDIYAFSIWTLGLNGLYSATANMDVTATNYVLGSYDAAPDSCLVFSPEFIGLAAAYNTSFGNPFYNEDLDIAPTFNGMANSYPHLLDQTIDFEDLVIFAINYDLHKCVAPVAGDPNQNRQLDRSSASAIAVMVEAPERVLAGNEVTIPVRVDEFAAVKGYHVVLSYNKENFELVNVEAGDAYKSLTESFIYFDKNSSHIDVSGVVMGSGIKFGSDELFRVVLRAKSTGDPDMGDVQMTFRDRVNTTMPASLGVVKTQVLPTSFAVSQNYPNPFNPTTTIQLSLPFASDYKLTIYNVIGQAVKTFEGRSEAGYQSILWDASGVASGIYLYRVEAGTFSATKKMVLLK